MHALQTNPVAIYARRAEATEPPQSITHQRRHGRASIAQGDGSLGEVQEFTDIVATASNLDRPKLAAMI
jgi:hypothetical protein